MRHVILYVAKRKPQWGQNVALGGGSKRRIGGGVKTSHWGGKTSHWGGAKRRIGGSKRRKSYRTTTGIERL